MAYQKASEQQKTLDSIFNEEKIISDVNDLDIGMTYIRCPRCDEEPLKKCTCESMFNYECMRCHWKHTNHIHDSNNINPYNSILRKYT